MTYVLHACIILALDIIMLSDEYYEDENIELILLSENVNHPAVLNSKVLVLRYSQTQVTYKF